MYSCLPPIRRLHIHNIHISVNYSLNISPYPYQKCIYLSNLKMCVSIGSKQNIDKFMVYFLRAWMQVKEQYDHFSLTLKWPVSDFLWISTRSHTCVHLCISKIFSSFIGWLLIYIHLSILVQCSTIKLPTKDVVTKQCIYSCLPKI